MRFFRQWHSRRERNASQARTIAARSRRRRHECRFEILEQRTLLTGESFGVIGVTDYYNNTAFSQFDGSGYVIAIIDTGFDLDHPAFGPDADDNDIADRIVYQYDFGDDDSNANHPTDGHGTHVASIIAEMLPGVDLILLKTMRDNGLGGSVEMGAALEWIVNNEQNYNFAAVNISLGEVFDKSQGLGFYTTPTTHEFEPEIYPVHDDLVALDGLRIPVITAAGNNFFDADSVQGVTFPAAHPLTIGVGATWDDGGGKVVWLEEGLLTGAEDNTHAVDRIPSFSFRHEDMTEIFAPGAFLDGAWLDGETETKGGTSAAAPHVAAAAVLAQQLNDEFGYQVGRLGMGDIVDLFQDTGVVINDGNADSNPEDDNVTNTGLNFPRLDVEAMAYKLFKPAAAPDLVFTSDWGFSETDNMTGDTTPTFSGTAPPNSHVWLDVDGAATANGQADGSGNFSLTSSVLTTGAKSITFKVAADSSVVDANRSQASPALSNVTIVTAETLNSSGTFNARLSETLVVPGTASAASEFAIAWSASAPERSLTKTGSGTVTIPTQTADISSRTVSVTFNANGGTSIFNSDTGIAGIPNVSTRAANWTMNVDATVEFTTSQNLGVLNILDDGLVEVVESDPPDYSVLYIGGPSETENKLDIASGGLLDLSNNGLVIDYSSSLSAGQVAGIANEIRGWLISGRGGVGVGNGTWTGTTGITSSKAATWNATNPEARSIGYAVNADMPLGPVAVFMGNSVDNSTIIARYTVTGDANLDGRVDDDDVTIVSASYAPGTPNPHWANGDADYNGYVDDDDVTLFGVFYEEELEP